MALKPPRPWPVSLALSILVGAALSIGGVMLMGIPGALLALPALILLSPFVSIPPNPFPQDSAWPFALMVSLFWGASVPVVWMATRAMGFSGAKRGLIVVLGVALAGVAIAALTYWFGVVPLLPEAAARQ